MKKLLLVSAFVLGVSAASFAQGMRMSAEERVSAMKTSLKLDDAQTAKVKAIYEGQTKMMDSLRNSGGDMMAGFTKMRETTNAKIKAVLTAEQQPIFQKQVDEQAAQMRQRMGN